MNAMTKIPNTAAAATALREFLPDMSQRDQDFGRSLLTAWNAGRASAKQCEWIMRLAERAMTPRAEPEPVKLASMDGLAALFRAAAGSIKYPRITFTCDDGSPIVMGLCGDRSRTPGDIRITDGQPYGSSEYYGRISRDGTFHPNPRYNAKVAIIQAIAADPVGTLAQNGRLTGLCCFCSRPLQDERSTEAGYGPICAKKWRLPWGGK